MVGFHRQDIFPSKLILILEVREPWEGQCSLASKLSKTGKHEIQKKNFFESMGSTHFLKSCMPTND